jgi:hypothetical protein
MVIEVVSNEEIKRKLAEKRNPSRKIPLEGGTVSSDELKEKFREKRNKEKETPGYLVCDTCGGYYELQLGELPDDFSDECECGGNLKHSKTVNLN